MRGSHHAPLMPVAAGQAHPSRFDGPPRVVCLDYLRRHGPFEPHRLPLDEME
jgi:fructose 1,6-bisphosphate aldolase/phosphatase